MIDIPERIFRMFLMKDDEPCLCMSGKPFKLCHKLLIEGGSEDRRKLLAELLKVKKRKECLFGYKSDCSDKIVKAHSISKLHL